MIAELGAADDFDGWRDTARELVRAGVAPERVTWRVAGEEGGDLLDFGVPPFPAGREAGDLPFPALPASPRVPARFIELAGKAALHRDPARFALLYRLLWRLQAAPGLLEDAADDDVRRLGALAREVRRDIHKMRAFVRFREVPDEKGERYVAWFEPGHRILRANAAFFVNRFAGMRWSILTPQGSLHWDGEILREGPAAVRGDAPVEDAAEDLWRRYFASIFNPARLKVAAMLKEMPRRYWANLPEAALIPELIAGAQAREAAMVERGEALFGEERRGDLDEIAAGIARCRRCPIGCNGTRAVAGEGPGAARLMIIGEQPGDSEERAGRPFVGPAGHVLRAALERAGIAVEQAWLTNAVKHFKFTRPTGKRRLHQNPSTREIDICRWWVESERMLVRPKVVLALGASAARAVLGRTVSVQRMRGQAIGLEDGSELWITTHPSYLLRLGEGAREAEEARFASDLAAVAQACEGFFNG